jgi:hypothetical protein
MAVTATISANPKVDRLSDEKFPIRNRSLHLSLELREKEVVACLLDKHLNKYIAWATFSINGKEKSTSDALKEDFFASTIADTSVVFTPNSSILVPALYFKKELVNDYLGFQQLDKLNETPCFDYIKNLDSYNLYTVNNESLSIMREVFPNASFRHHSSIFIEYLLIENKSMHEDKVYITVFNKYMDVAVLQSGKLVLSNRFYYENDSDFMYYLLWVYEQLNLDTEKVPCVFYGEINPEKFAAAGKYIQKTKLGARNEQSGYVGSLDKLTVYKYRSLFTQYLCV